jgi:hypothetical protein
MEETGVEKQIAASLLLPWGGMNFCVARRTAAGYRGGRRMEFNEIVAKKRNQRKRFRFYAPFAPFRGYSLVPRCGLCYQWFIKQSA